jgi:DNA invertase Pin-like site-specific DNA recombinase
VYCRQSTEEQKRRNTGSADFQRGQKAHILALGYGEDQIDVLTKDLGKSGTSTENRTDYQAMVDGILADEVTAIAVSEISRLGRDYFELTRFLTLCEWKNVLILENGSPKNLRDASDWLSTTIKAVFARQENRDRTTRSQNGWLTKMKQGISTSRLPAPFDRGPRGEVLQSADDRVREKTRRVWREVLEGRSVRRIGRDLRAEGRQLPVRAAGGQIRWVSPTRRRLRRMLENPLFAGYVVIGRYRIEREPGKRKQVRITPRDEQEWIPATADQVQRYVTPEEFERVQVLIAARINPSGGIPRSGEALCTSGLLQCPLCVRSLYVSYYSALDPAHPRHGHRYTCKGRTEDDRDLGRVCFSVSGQMVDRTVTDIVLSAIQSPSPSMLGRAIREENGRRQAAGRLVAAEVRQAEAAVADARDNLEDFRRRRRTSEERNPEVMQMYEDEVATAIRALQGVRRRQAALPPPTLIETTPAALAELARAFRLFPGLWRSGRLALEDRKAIVRHVIARIEIGAGDDGTFPMKVILHTGTVLERTLVGPAGRRALMQALAAEGKDYAAIAATLQERGILNNMGRPFTAEAVWSNLYRTAKLQQIHPAPPKHLRGQRRVTDAALRELWAQALPMAQIAARLNTQGLQTGKGKPWTKHAVFYMAKRLGLPPRYQMQREALRAPMAELVDAGWDDAAIAEEFTARGVRGFTGRPWTAANLKHVRLLLGLHHPLQRRKRIEGDPGEGTSTHKEAA